MEIFLWICGTLVVLAIALYIWEKVDAWRYPDHYKYESGREVTKFYLYMKRDTYTGIARYKLRKRNVRDSDYYDSTFESNKEWTLIGSRVEETIHYSNGNKHTIIREKSGTDIETLIHKVET